MRGFNLVKICSLIGLCYGLFVAVYVAFAPRMPGKASSMFVPEIFVPTEVGVEPNVQPPTEWKVKSMFVLGFFLGPFGALAGCGVGLLLDGAIGTFRKYPAVGAVKKPEAAEGAGAPPKPEGEPLK